MDIAINKKLNFTLKTNNLILKKISFIDTFKGKWNIIENKENRYLQELRKIATIESIGSSTRIEGVKLTDKEIEKIINNVKIDKLKTRDEQEVVGYWETLDTVIDNYKNIDITENYVKQFHSILLKYSAKDTKHKGSYKQLSNKVVATYPDGTQRTVFNATEPHLVDKEMSELIMWINETIKEEEIHPLIFIAVFVYEFLSIHPFQDGNGRLSRLLTTLLLLQQDYLFIQYVSFEKVIEDSKKDYYKALVEGQKDRNTEKEKLDSWVLYFLDSLSVLIQKLEKKYEIYKNTTTYLNDRQKSIKELIIKHQPVKISDLVKQMPETSRNTIKKDLTYLRNENIVEVIGKNKGTLYVMKKDN
ncbi:MAG: Fic family protein [Bacteroidales bacterium]|nr:Fic family protein [Bacteroidales bacterium]MBN2755590.1 Fic family protein [Bacteroidales bacterium]